MNILLVNPSQKAVYGKLKSPVQMHMGLAYIASMLVEKKHHVRIMDIDAENIGEEDFLKALNDKRYDIAGFTVTTPTFFPSLKLAEKVKEHTTGTLIVFGGIHPTVRAHEVIKFNCVDVVIKGEGEITFEELSEVLSRDGDLSAVKGLVYKKDGKIKETSSRDLIEDLDALPFPARHLFKNREYVFPDALYRNTAPIITSRGCPGMCTYCAAYKIFKKVFRARSARNIIDEMEFLAEKMGVKEIHIWDDNFITIKKRVFEIRDEILKRKLKLKFAFPNGVRADFLNEEVMKALKEMGTYSIAIGVESGVQEVLDKARKGIKLQKVEEAFALAKKMRLETWAFFMIGLPGESHASIEKTIEFARKLDPDVAKFHILKPYPGTEVYDYLEKRGLILTEDYNRFGIHTPPVHKLEGLTPEDMVEWQRKAYISFYLRPAKILNQILRIRTYNRFLNNFQAGMGLAKMILLSKD